MKKVVLLLCLVTFISCSEDNFKENDSIYGYWKQEVTTGDVSSIVEINDNSELIVYKLIWNEKCIVEKTLQINLIEKPIITISYITMSYKIENGKLTIFDENHGTLYQYPFVRCDKPDLIPIPKHTVNFSLDLNFQDQDLNRGIYSTKSITNRRWPDESLGFGGILVISGIGKETVNLYAYDLACPVECDKDIKVVPDNVGKAKCPKCGAVYNIVDGSGAPESVSKYPLMPYKVVRANNGRHNITNYH